MSDVISSCIYYFKVGLKFFLEDISIEFTWNFVNSCLVVCCHVIVTDDFCHVLLFVDK